MKAEYLGSSTEIMTHEQLYAVIGRFPNGNHLIGDIEFLKFYYNDKMILVPSETLVYNLSWTQIQDMGLVAGKNITVANNEFFIRCINGGDSASAKSEWNDIMVANKSEIDSIIKKKYWSYCKEDSVRRGLDTLDSYSKNNLIKGENGFRPLFECYPKCDISISNKEIGNISEWANIEYVVTGSTHTLITILDDVEIEKVVNQPNPSDYILDLSSRWNDMSYGKHNIMLRIIDNVGIERRVTITFNKIKPPITTLPTTASLKQAIEYNKEIDKEIDYQLFRFKEVLKEKGVEVTESDKVLASLINKVGDIELGKKWANGETVKSSSGLRFNNASGSSTTIMSYAEIPKLDFAPSVVILISKPGDTFYPSMSVISYDNHYSVLSVKCGGYYNGSYGSSNTYNLKADNLVFMDNVIRVPVNGDSNNNYMWYAYE